MSTLRASETAKEGLDTSNTTIAQAANTARQAVQSAVSSDLLRLEPISLDSVPFHSRLAASQDHAKCPLLTTFVFQALAQTREFVAKSIPPFQGKKLKKSKGSEAGVEVQTWTVGKDYWVARQSKHAGKTVEGDASWAEFDGYLRNDHSKYEKEYTPGVVDANEVCRWSDEELRDVDGWTDVNVAVFEMKHQIPSPLKARVFSILTISGIPSDSASSFFVVTLPLLLSSGASSKLIEGSKYTNSTSVVHGAYVAVEHVFTKTEADGSDGPITWIMATASDAKGSLPMAVQKLGIPPAVTKDVGLMLNFAHEKRGAKA